MNHFIFNSIPDATSMDFCIKKRKKRLFTIIQSQGFLSSPQGFNQVFNSQNLIRRLPRLIPPRLFFSLDIDMCDEKRKRKKSGRMERHVSVFALLPQTRLKFLWCLFSEREVFFENMLHSSNRSWLRFKGGF